MKNVAKAIGAGRGRRAAIAPLAFSLVVVLSVFSDRIRGDEPSPADKSAQVVEPTPGNVATKPARKNVKLPGLLINFQQRCVDLESSVCLDRGFLELIACTKGSKEHESIVALTARPMHIHTALLLLGINSGNPAMRKPIDKQGTRWIDIPPKGDPVRVSLVFKSSKGKMVEYPISDFITRSEMSPDEKADSDTDDADEDTEFPHTFLFAGSLLRGEGPGPRKYLADHSGNVISIATFGDELLCLPGVQSHENGALMWQVDATELPEVGSKVTLRLRPQVQPVPKSGDAGHSSPIGRSGKGRQ